jgi:hypothetical protein
MASERQILANRGNANKSTGPRSPGGKKRTCRNAYRHGLSMSIAASTAGAKQIEKLAQKIVRDVRCSPTDMMALQYARTIAEADLDLARVRRAKVLLIERVRVLGASNRKLFKTVGEIRRVFNALDWGIWIEAGNPAETMPPQEPERTAVAFRRALPELRKLNRYEQRAFARRNRALGKLLIASGRRTNPILRGAANGIYQQSALIDRQQRERIRCFGGTKPLGEAETAAAPAVDQLRRCSWGACAVLAL